MLRLKTCMVGLRHVGAAPWRGPLLAFLAAAAVAPTWALAPRVAAYRVQQVERSQPDVWLALVSTPYGYTIYRRADQKPWQEVQQVATDHDPVSLLRVRDGEWLIEASDSLLASRDHGATWQRQGPRRKDLVADGSGTLYGCSAERTPEKSTDLGKTWQPMPHGPWAAAPHGEVQSCRIAASPGKLYVVQELANAPQLRLRVAHSSDGGRRWQGEVTTWTNPLAGNPKPRMDVLNAWVDGDGQLLLLTRALAGSVETQVFGEEALNSRAPSGRWQAWSPSGRDNYVHHASWGRKTIGAAGGFVFLACQARDTGTAICAYGRGLKFAWRTPHFPNYSDQFQVLHDGTVMQQPELGFPMKWYDRRHDTWREVPVEGLPPSQ
jgi:hypothetical protein